MLKETDSILVLLSDAVTSTEEKLAFCSGGWEETRPQIEDDCAVSVLTGSESEVAEWKHREPWKQKCPATR